MSQRMNSLALAVDVGGSSVKLGVIAAGCVVASTTLPARPAEPFAMTLRAVSEQLDLLIDRGAINRSHCTGIGVGLPCIVDCRRGHVISSPAGKYEDASGTDLSAWACQAFGLPIRIDNDAHLALLGEWEYGAGQGADNLIMVTLGTGVGCSVLIGGRPLRGRHYQAGLLGGFTVINSGGRRCSESAPGCVEAETGSWALPEIARQQSEFASSRLATVSPIDYEAVFRLADESDPLAIALRNRSLDLWSDFVINLIHLFDPERIVLGGAVLRRAEIVIPWIQRRVDAHAWTPWGRVAIVGARFPDVAGLLGAEVMLRRELSYL